MKGRITFAGNPWANGHALEEMGFSAQIEEDGALRLGLSLESTDYCAEDDEDTVEDEEDDSDDWTSRTVWENYHACTMSGLFPFHGKLELAALSGRELHVDPVTPGYDPEQGSFEVYLLGHDSVADHRITFTGGPTEFSLFWTGKIALTYAGEEEFKHDFTVRAEGVSFEGIFLPEGVTDEAAARELLAQQVEAPDSYEFVSKDGLVCFRPRPR